VPKPIKTNVPILGKDLFVINKRITLLKPGEKNFPGSKWE
jgi:hypothetical protein